MSDKVKIKTVSVREEENCAIHGLHYIGPLVEIEIPDGKNSTIKAHYCSECITAYKKAFTLAEQAVSMDSFSAEYDFFEKEKVTK